MNVYHRKRLIHICSFSAVTIPRRTHLTYEILKEAVLKAGRFSCFEATETMKRAELYTTLCADPEIETWDLGYPWTGVRRRGE